MHNAQVAELLENVAAALELKQESRFRIRAYQEAARNIAYMTEDVGDLWKQNKLDAIPGVGPSIAEKIADFLAHGRSDYLDSLCQRMPSGVLDLTRLPGLGPRKALVLYESLHIQSLDELAEACRQGKVRTIRGMGAKTEAAILKEIERLADRSKRIPLGIALPLAERIAATLRGCSGISDAEPAGSIRRRKETVGDIDILVGSSDPSAVQRAIAKHLPFQPEILVQGPTKITFLAPGPLQIDVRVVDPSAWGAALQYFTGSKAHNIVLRERAIRQGLKLNEYGLFVQDSGLKVAGRTEAGIYDRLGMEWMPPELRENTGEIEAALAGRLPRLIDLDDVRGDFHTHSTYSDGEAKLEDMVRAAMARRYEFLAFTDHSPGLGVARGLDADKRAKQHEEIVRLNRKYAPFKILWGIELEIRASGDLDLPDDVLAEFDLVTVSVHTATRQAAERITARMVGALEHPAVRILNHPSGRLLGIRPAYDFDLDRVLAVAHARHKAIEINGSYLRLDLSDSAARRARDRGVLLSLGSDAHSVEGLDAMRLAIAVARRAWLEPREVINTWPLERLLYCEQTC